jgi:hypothetical protein
MHETHTSTDERFEFTSGARNKIILVGVIGVALFALGVFLASMGGGEHEGGHGAITTSSDNLLASVAPVQEEAKQEEAKEGEAVGGHEEGNPLVKRIITSLWHNNVFFTGIGIIGLFFIAIQYAAQAGWSAPIKRIPLAIGHWIPFAGLLMLVIYFAGSHDLFHWTHSYLYAEGETGDEILKGKSAYFFWPLGGGEFPAFFVFRMVLFFGLWFLFFTWIKKEMLAEDVNGGVAHWYSARSLSTVFLIIFAVSSSIAAWDWVMSIDPHWFSTMFGWYVFASWWVTGLSVIALILIYLKQAGYLKQVNDNHLHDLGKFIFGFSIFWTYIWFCQFMLIYYAHLPEETVYFIVRKTVSPYSWIFYTNIILNFVLPFLLLMPRDSKRKMSMMKVVCFIVIVGHWFDFYNMITPGIMKFNGTLGFVEIGLGLTFLSIFLLVVLNALTKFPLVAKNHPMMAESMNHHI